MAVCYNQNIIWFSKHALTIRKLHKEDNPFFHVLGSLMKQNYFSLKEISVNVSVN